MCSRSQSQIIYLKELRYQGQTSFWAYYCKGLEWRLDSMTPALIQFFKDYGRKKGTELFKKHLSEMEGIEGGLTYGKIMKLSKEERPEFNSERYLRTVKLFGKSNGFLSL
jgi:hypothetical protein